MSSDLAAGAGQPIRVLIVDDEALVRAGFRLLIDAAADLAVVAEASDGVAAVRTCRQVRPDVVLMDIRMPVMDGLEATRLIAPDAAKPRILVVTTFDDDEYVFEALQAGAAGFILKDTQPENLLAAVRTVAAGDSLLAPAITRRLIAEFVRRPRQRRPTTAGPDLNGVLATLTERERTVLILIAAGYSNAEIAKTLHVSVSTIKTHVGHLLTKLAARDRIQLVIAAYESGLAIPGNAVGPTPATG